MIQCFIQKEIDGKLSCSKVALKTVLQLISLFDLDLEQILCTDKNKF